MHSISSKILRGTDENRIGSDVYKFMSMSEELVKKITLDSWSKWARENFLEFSICPKSKYLMTGKQLMIFKECIKERPYEYVKYVKQ